jgi:urease accessory protein
MIVIEHIPAPPVEILAGRRRDTLRLTWEGRRWTRRRAVTSQGREIALALPTGTVLALGAVLWIDREWYLEVEGAPEPVIVVRPRSHQEALRIAFEVGNRHFSIALYEDAMLVPDDIAMSQLLERLDVRWSRAEAVYTPIGFGHGHTHANGVEHGHAHDAAGGHTHVPFASYAPAHEKAAR